MKMKRLVMALVMLTMGGALLVAQSNAMTPKEQANLKFVLDWWREVLEGRHLDLAPKYQAANYIQHNINVPTGRDGFVKFFSALPPPFGGPPVNPIPAKLANPPAVQFAKGDFVALIWEREAKDPTDASKMYKYNTYDLLRLQDGKVQEHWDYALKNKGTPTGGAPDGIDYDAVKFNLSAQEQKNLETANVEFKDILQYGHVEPAIVPQAGRLHNQRVAVPPAGRIAVSPRLRIVFWQRPAVEEYLAKSVVGLPHDQDEAGGLDNFSRLGVCMELHEPQWKTMRVRIVFLIVRHPLPPKLRAPRCERQRLLHSKTDVPELAENVGNRAVGQRSPSRAADAHEDPRCRLKIIPDPGQIRFAVRCPRRRRGQIHAAVRCLGRSGRPIRRPLRHERWRTGDGDECH